MCDRGRNSVSVYSGDGEGRNRLEKDDDGVLPRSSLPDVRPGSASPEASGDRELGLRASVGDS